MISNTRLTESEFHATAERVQQNGPDDLATEFNSAVQFHRGLAPNKRFTRTLRHADHVLLQPRGGVARLSKQIALLNHLESEGSADLLPTTIDSYTRDNEYAKARDGLERSRETGDSHLNGFPAVTHGVDGCRELVEAVERPVQVRHGTPDARLLALVTLAGGFQSFEGGPISYNLPYTNRHDLAETIEYWQFVDRLCGAYTNRGVKINREPFGPLTGTLVPPCVAITICIIEGLLAATQGVRSVTLGYGQVGNLVQDVAALRAIRALGDEYLPNDVTVTTVFHQWMGGFPRDEAQAHGVIGLGGLTAGIAEPDKVITKSPQEAAGVPTAESNAAGLRATGQALHMLSDQEIALEGMQQEYDLISRSVRSLLAAVRAAGDGDIAKGTIDAFETGQLDVPFPPSDASAGDLLPVRDDRGRVRLLKFGNLALTDDIRDIHRSHLEDRAATEGRRPSFRMVADDVSAVSEGGLIGRPDED